MTMQPVAMEYRLEGEGLTLEPWSHELARQMAGWDERGFPFHAFDLGYLRDSGQMRAMLHWMQSERKHRHFVACENGEAVGRTSVNLEDAAGLYIWAVHVPPDHEGRGVARRMLRVVIDWLHDAYVGSDIVLTTNTFATAAHRVYASLGFEVIETRWQYDSELSKGLWRGGRDLQVRMAPHVRFANGHWEVRTHLMRLPGKRQAVQLAGA